MNEWIFIYKSQGENFQTKLLSNSKNEKKKLRYEKIVSCDILKVGIVKELIVSFAHLLQVSSLKIRFSVDSQVRFLLNAIKKDP